MDMVVCAHKCLYRGLGSQTSKENRLNLRKQARSPKVPNLSVTDPTY